MRKISLFSAPKGLIVLRIIWLLCITYNYKTNNKEKEHLKGFVAKSSQESSEMDILDTIIITVC